MMSNQPIRYTTPYRFHGGIHPEENKHWSNGSAISKAPLAPQLIIPVAQHAGTPAVINVQVGDAVLGGQLIAESGEGLSAPVHASSSGVVKAIEFRPVAHPSGLVDLCIVIETDGQDLQTKMPAIKNPLQADKHLLLRRIHEAGIVGLGGAAFPSHVKVNTVIETLIINAAECEPYITCDDRLIRDHTDDLGLAFQLLTKLTQAKRCIIGIEDNKPEAIEALENWIRENQDDSIQICVVPTKYPSGGEKQLIELITGKQVPRGKRPSDLGLVLHNVATAYAMFRAIVYGEALTERVVTLTGQALHVRGNYWVKIGTPVEWLLQHMSTNPIEHIIMGGPMMGFEIKSFQAPVVKATNCLIAAAAGELEPIENTLPCIRCGECTQVCPASLLPQQLYWFARGEQFDKAQDYHLFDCIECGACSYVCPSHIPLVQYYRFAKTEIRQRNQEKEKADIARARHEFRDFRLQREKSERAEKHRKAAEARQQAAQAKGEQNDKQSAIADAVARAKARKKQLDKE